MKNETKTNNAVAVKGESKSETTPPKKWTLRYAHQWTNGGDRVLSIRFVGKNGEARGGFRYPMIVGATVKAPDARRNDKCGGGLHAWPWGLGVGDGKEPDWQATWLVLASAPARAGKFGCIALAWWNEKKQRAEMRCALTGRGGIKPDVWYELDARGKFVACKDQGAK